MPQSLPDRSELVRLNTILTALVEEVRRLSDKVDDLKDDHMSEAERDLAVIEERLSLQDDRLKTIEGYVGKIVKSIIAQGVALVGGLILWALQHA